MGSVLQGDIITLDDEKEYVCYGRIEDKKNTYLYLMSNSEPLEIRFAKEIIEGNDVFCEIIYEQDEKEYVLELFKDVMSKK